MVLHKLLYLNFTLQVVIYLQKERIFKNNSFVVIYNEGYSRKKKIEGQEALDVKNYRS